ncbi:MAG: DUF4838 domain-containing protein [Planctomycetes bacterium]|nr:DUF4838 domain-containing protein [Planctomycetota bacterium]
MVSGFVEAICRICVCLSVLAFCGADGDGAAGSEVVLVQSGRSDWHISLRPGASAPERLAARELAEYVQKISRAAIEVVEESRPSSKAVRIECEDGGWDGFDLTVMPDQITIHGHTPRGALYGAYQLLETMGCRWYFIGRLGEVVPKHQRVALPIGESHQKASFRDRSVMIAYPHYYERFDEWIDFLTKSRVNNLVIYGRSASWWQKNRDRYLPLLRERQTIIEFGGHILATFVPRTLFAAHPEYFRMNEKGQRIADHNFCPNSGALAVLQENARKFFQELPEVTYFHVWADDLKGGGWCHCPRCKALAPQDQNMLAMNAIAEVLAEVNPRASLALLAYHDTGKVSRIRPAANLFLFHAPRERCYRHAINDPDCRRNRSEYLPDWLALRAAFQKTAPKTIHEFGYYTDALLNREMQPPHINVLPADARYFRSLHLPVWQNLMVSFRAWHSPPFSMVAFTRAAWNADVDGQQLLEDFCRHYYGKDAAPEMVAYYRRVEEACNLLFEADAIVGPYTDMTWPPLAPDVRKRKIADVKQARRVHAPLAGHLADVLDEMPAGLYAERLRRERDVCELHDLLIRLAHCQFEGRFLGLRYLAGGVGDAEGRRAAELLAEGVKTVEQVVTWMERFPDEQGGLLHGWQKYYSSYERILSELESRVRQKLAKSEGGSR